MMDYATFLAKFAAVFEHSPWVADAVFETGGGRLNDTESLADRFESVFMAADPVRQLATIKAHPQLACALADPGKLTPDSVNEQSGAGLDRCSAEELDEFSRLNAAYNKKFGFPFIIAVKGRTRQQILQVFRERLENDAPAEYQAALQQACRIARLRIGDILDN
jgi:OHCU decarboxylase